MPSSSPDDAQAGFDAEAHRAQSVRAREVLAGIQRTREMCQETNERLEKSGETAKQVLSEIRTTMAKWDKMKAEFGQALDGAIRRMADAMTLETVPAIDGPPSGPTAHGTLLAESDRSLLDPRRVVECSEVARPKMISHVPAHEYADEPVVLRRKVKELAKLISRAGGNTALYTGAGISTAAGICDYASKAGTLSSVLPAKEKILNGTPFSAGDAIDAEPTFAHHMLCALYTHGHFDEWIQQNHDGLPQKAGVPQSVLNEIHGGWFDPSNPVVPMDGALRVDLVKRLRHTASTTRLVIAMGTSLSGVAADQVVCQVANRASQERQAARATLDSIAEEETSGQQSGVVIDETLPDVHTLGSVIINVQQTRLDGLATLRIFAKIDDVMRMLGDELGVDVAPAHGQCYDWGGKGLVSDVWAGLPYNPTTGEPVAPTHDSEDAPCRMRLDLRKGQRIRLVQGNAPMTVAGTEGTITRKTSQGHYQIDCADGKRRILGTWMIDAACKGELDHLPLVNA